MSSSYNHLFCWEGGYQAAAQQERLLAQSFQRVYGNNPPQPLTTQNPLDTLAIVAANHRGLSVGSSQQTGYINHNHNNHQPFINQIQQCWPVGLKQIVPPVIPEPTSLALSSKVPLRPDEVGKVDLQKQKKAPPAVIAKPAQALPTDVQFESDKTLSDNGMQRKMGRIRYFDEKSGSYGSWIDIFGGQVGETRTITLNLSRGGILRILCNILPENKRKDLSRAMHDCKLYRQYSLSRNENFAGFQEPRSHVLLSSKVQATIDDDKATNNERQHQPGYSYHGIRMKALPINLVPEVESYAEDLARTYNLSQWDIGVDMIAYKDGCDSIGWHADDTQGETIVVCVVVDAPGEVRPLYIRPNKRTKPLRHGDEEIQLFIAEGDGYDMDGYMQDNYEHSLPKKLKNMDHRFVLIFRQGDTVQMHQDSGDPILKNGDKESIGTEDWNVVSAITKLRPKTEKVIFGHPKNVNLGECYSRRYLWANFAHRADQRGINGNVQDGADSIVVSRQDFGIREEDGLSWLRYTSSRRQGGGALVVSFRLKKPVRVFRSSNLKGPYRPESFEDNRTSYRYDGLYLVTHVWNSEGNLTNGDIPAGKGGVQFTFHLERLRHPENPMSTDELHYGIQQSRCFGPQLPFKTPQPRNSDDVLPVIQKTESPLATATSTTIQLPSARTAFQQSLSISQGASIELSRFIESVVTQETEEIISKARVKRKVKRKDAEKKERKNNTSAARLPVNVDKIFGCVLDDKPLPEIDFKLIITEDAKLSAPPFDYEVGIYVLVDREFPIPSTLSDRVVSIEPLTLMDGRWTIGGCQTLNLTDSRFTFQKRSVCPKGQNDSKGSFAKRGTLYTLVGKKGDWLDCKILHVYHSKAGKVPQVSAASPLKMEMPMPVKFAIKESVYAYDKGKSGSVLYEAQVIKTKEDKTKGLRYYVHYKGYKNSHNRWLSSNEIMKQTKLNRSMYLKSRPQPLLTPKPSVKTNARATNVSKDSKKRKRCSGSEIAEKCENESKRKRQSSPVRRSARCAQTFQVKEKVFAPDKKKSTIVLYEATVIKLKEDVAGCLKYWVQYKGYSKSHNQWLGAKDLLKETRQNRVRFEKSRM